MRTLFFILFGAIFLCCGGKKAHPTALNQPGSTSEKAETILPDSIVRFPSYSLFRPADITDTGTVALLVLLDPQGQGELPLKKYRNLVSGKHILLAGSNQCRNGMRPDEAQPIVSSLITDVKARFPQKKLVVFLAGFSGGAVLALELSKSIPDVQGLLYAAAPGNNLPTVPAIGFAGLGDPNFRDMQIRESQLSAEQPHFLSFWKGKHEWPDENTMVFAFQWMEAKVSPEKTGPFFEACLKENQLDCIYSCKDAKWRKLAFLSLSLNQKSDAPASLDAYLKSPESSKLRTVLAQEIKMEMAQKSAYQQAFFEKNPDWWREEYQKITLKKPVPWENQRMLGFLSLLAYSASTQAIKMNDTDRAAKFISTYSIVDPENPEPAYLQAVLLAKQSRPEPCRKFIQEAIRLGFSDIGRIQKQPEFRGMGLESLLSK